MNRAGEESPPRMWERYDWLLAAVLFLFIVAAARTIISWDSHLYLASAKSLFWPEMAQWYHWIREPLYPAQLRLSVGVFGSADIGTTAVQALIVVGAASLFVSRAFPTRRVSRRVVLALIVANPIVIGMVGFIGQQATMLALMCLCGAWVHAISSPSRPSRDSLILISVVLGALLALTSVLLMPVVFALGGLSLLSGRHLAVASGSSHRESMDRRVFGAAIVVSAVLALAVWWSAKAIVMQQGESAYEYPSWIWEYSSDGTVSFWDTALGFLSLGPDVDGPAEGVAFELIVFGGLREPFSDRCGVVYSGDIASVYSAGYVVQTCRPAWASEVKGRFAGVGLLLHRVALLWLLAAVALAVFVPRLRLPAVLAVAFSLPYVVGGLGISRYAVPLYPLAAASGVDALVAGLRHRCRRTS